MRLLCLLLHLRHLKLCQIESKKSIWFPLFLLSCDFIYDLLLPLIHVIHFSHDLSLDQVEFKQVFTLTWKFINWPILFTQVASVIKLLPVHDHLLFSDSKIVKSSTHSNDQLKNVILVNTFHLDHFENNELILKHVVRSIPSLPSHHHELGFWN